MWYRHMLSKINEEFQTGFIPFFEYWIPGVFKEFSRRKIIFSRSKSEEDSFNVHLQLTFTLSENTT